jgi:hypothetical protein
MSRHENEVVFSPFNSPLSNDTQRIHVYVRSVTVNDIQTGYAGYAVGAINGYNVE